MQSGLVIYCGSIFKQVCIDFNLAIEARSFNLVVLLIHQSH